MTARARQIREWAELHRTAGTLVAEHDAAYRRRWKKAHGIAAAWRLADGLRASVMPRPDDHERLADLAVHLRVSDALRKVERRRR